MSEKELAAWLEKANKEIDQQHNRSAKSLPETSNPLDIRDCKVNGKAVDFNEVFPDNGGGTVQECIVFDPMTKEDAIAYLDRENEDNNIVHSPFYSFVGNKEAVETICSRVAIALQREDHCCTANFALYGPGGCGKTQLAKVIAETLGIPFIRIDGRSEDIKTTSDLFEEIVKIIESYYENEGVNIQIKSGCAPKGITTTEDSNTFHLPPCIVFLDEAHALNRSLKENILTAIEKTDAQMRVSIKGDSFIVYTDRVCWIMATTDKGKISSPLKTRFKAIYMKNYTVDELMMLVAWKCRYPAEVCLRIAKYCRSSARAASDFAANIKDELEGLTTEEMLEVVTENAEREGMTIVGLNLKQFKVLEFLANNSPMSQDDLANAMEVGVEELTDDILPALKVACEDWPKLIETGSRGLSLTEKGREFLMQYGEEVDPDIDTEIAEIDPDIDPDSLEGAEGYDSQAAEALDKFEKWKNGK